MLATMNNIKSGDNVLILWNNSDPNDLSNLVNEIQNVNASVVLENSSMIAEGELIFYF